MKDNTQRLLDILKAIDLIGKYSVATTKLLKQDEMRQIWIAHHLQIIGEAASQLPEELRLKHPQIPWHKIIGMRHRLVHDYFNIDVGELWRTVRKDLPDLKDQIESILAGMSEEVDTIEEEQ